MGNIPLRVQLNPENLRAYFETYLKDQKAQIWAAHRDGAPAEVVLSAMTGLTDEVLNSLSLAMVRQVEERGQSWPEQDFSLVALGGYGRKELFPYSDVDLMMLYREGANRAVTAYARRMLQMLWDLGFHVGHSLRTIQDCLEIGRADLTTRTSLMEARLLYGNADLFNEFSDRFWSRVGRRRADEFILAKVKERAAEYARYGSTVYQLEPDVKKSKGGLRDLNLLNWVSSARYGVSSLEGFIAKGLLTPKEVREGRAAKEFLWRVRIELHLHAHRCQDMLSFDEQIRLARLFGYEDEASLLGVEKFMRDYYRHSTTAHEISNQFVRRALSRSSWKRLIQRVTSRVVDDYFTLSRYEISVMESRLDDFLRNPGTVLKLFHLSQVYGIPVSRRTQALLHEQVDRLPEGQWADPDICQQFLSILSRPGRISEILNLLHRVYLLEKIIPEYEQVHYLMQFNQYHKYTIDEHCIRALGQAEALAGQDNIMASVFREIKRKDLLHLALLLHDIGKGRGGDHCLIGEAIAKRTAERFGLSAEDSAVLAFLVRDHLVMAHTAFRRDLSDEGVLLQFAKKVAQPETLMMLYVLTYADIAAVGPDTWTPWKKDLLTELYVRTLEALTGAAVAMTQEERCRQIRLEVEQSLAGAYPGPWLQTQLDAMTHRYLLTTPVAKITKHLEKIDLLWERQVMVESEYCPEYGTSEIAVHTFDHLIPGIFSKISGVMAAKGLQILGAQIHTRRDGVVVDTFQVMDPDYASCPPPHRFDHIAQSIREVLLGQTTVEEIFSRSTRFPSDPGFPLRFEPTQVEINNDISERYTVIDVFAHDRQGLLYVITKSIFDLALSVHFAKVATRLDQVVDVFYVTDLEGMKIDSTERLQSIRQTLAAKIDAFLISSRKPASPESA